MNTSFIKSWKKYIPYLKKNETFSKARIFLLVDLQTLLL